MRKLYGVLAVAGVALASCRNGNESPKFFKPDILKAHLDLTVRPADDFFAFANGGWIKRNPIPSDETSYGIGELVQKELYARLLKINHDALKKGDKTGSSQQIGDFWYSAMDTAGIESTGIRALQPELDIINNIQDRGDLMAMVARMHGYGAAVFFDEGVEQDPKRSDVYAYGMVQGGLGLPSRDYYFNTDARATKIRDAYPGYITRLFVLMGVEESEAQQKAANIIALETTLAGASRKLEDLRDPYANYNKYAIGQLNYIAPNIDFPSYLAYRGITAVDSVIVGQPEFYQQLDNVIATADGQTIKDYMAFHLVSEFAPYLNKAFVDARFDFYSRTIRGAQEQYPRWRRALIAEEGALGESLGKLFVKEYFSGRAKERYEKMVENVRTAYKNRIEKLEWMTPATKEKAIHKLMSISKKVGYPDKWKDLSGIKIDRGPYALNIMRANQFWVNYDLAKLGKEVDRTEWSMTPQTYNAYYNESNNEIVLPAAMMTVPGYRDEELDDALVYGLTAASTVGHEITHGFDDQGRQYDEHGNLSMWWTDEDTAAFIQRANVLVEQFNAMVPIDTMHINGRATLGENLADLGGILIGLDAFKQTDAYKKGGKIGGLTQLQRFFLGYSLGWMMQQRPERLADQLLVDVHSPAKFRVNGPFPNVPEFYQAFNIKPGDKMYLPDSLRVNLW